MTSINLSQPLRVYGYHGTSREKAQEIIDCGFNLSTNDYDWLGTGVYFFQPTFISPTDEAHPKSNSNPNEHGKVKPESLPEDEKKVKLQSK